MMKAIFSTSGTQFRVKTGDVLTVDRVAAEPGSKVVYDKVLLLEDDDNITVGDPVVPQATVTAEIIEHFRGKKVRVFKMRRRKKSRRLRGHRSELSKIVVTDINTAGQKGAQ